MKKLFIIMLVMVLTIIMVISGCSKAIPAPTSTTMPTPTTELPKKVIELKFALHFPPGSAMAKVYEEWAKKISEDTKGEVKITIYPASTLLGQQDIIPGIKGGLTDIGEIALQDHIAEFPLTNILLLDFLPSGTVQEAHTMWSDLENKFPELKTESKDFKLITNLTRGSMNPTQVMFHTSKKLIKVPGDIKGMKLLALGQISEVFKAQGASCIFVDLPDWYTSLDRGLVEGIYMYIDVIYDFKIYPLTPYHTEFPVSPGYGRGELVMNLGTWNRLSPGAQKAFDDSGHWLNEKFWESATNAEKTAITTMKGEEQTFYTLTQQENKLWQDAALPFHEKYLAKLEAQGLPAKAMYADLLRLVEQYKK